MERRQESELLENIRARRTELAKLLEDSSGHWGYEDPVYRYYHSRFFLEMAVRYGDIPSLPHTLPSGWAALLYLYDLR